MGARLPSNAHIGAVDPLRYGVPIKLKCIDCLKLNRFYRYAGACTGVHSLAQPRTKHLVDRALKIDYWRNGHVELRPQLGAFLCRR